MLYAACEMFQPGEEHGGRDEHSEAFWSALVLRAGGRNTAQGGNDGSDSGFFGMVEPFVSEWPGAASLRTRSIEEQVAAAYGTPSRRRQRFRTCRRLHQPILQPWAAEVVKKFGEISLAGK